MDENYDRLREAVTMPSRDWTKQHIEVLPKKFLLDKVSTFTLHHIWNDLPEDLKKDNELQSHLPCLEHYNRDDDEIHIDGPPPPKYRCRGCRREQLENMRKRDDRPRYPRSLS